MHDLARLQVKTPVIADWARAGIGASALSDLMVIHIKTKPERGLPLETLGFSKPGCVSMIGPFECLWLGPAEWLLLAPRHQARELSGILRQAADQGAAFADAQDRLVIIELNADAHLLTGLTGLPSGATRAGRVARTRLADIPVTLVGGFDRRFRLLFDRSYAPHVRAWLDRSI